MKLSFSTVGCPRWTWGEILSAAADLGYDGLEIRGLGDDLYLPASRQFSAENLSRVKADLAARSLTPACLASDVFLHDAGVDAVAALRPYVALAAALGAPCVRVLGDAWAAPGKNVDLALVRRRLSELAPEAERLGVLLLVESNGVLADTVRLKALLEDVGSPSVGALWDIHHPVRFFGESVEQSFENIGRFVRHVHVKDSVVLEDGTLKYKMLGYGTLPVGKALSLLKSAGYKDFLSLEWTKRWNDDLEDAGIVFAHYVYQIRKLIGAA